MQKATLNSVAKQAGVSKTTASLVLSGKADSVNIAKSTQERVREVAKQLNYKPGKFHPGRLNGKTGILTIYMSTFLSCQNSLWLQHLIKAAQGQGYVIVPQLVEEKDLEHIGNQTPSDGAVFLDEEVIPKDPKSVFPDIPVICAGFKSKNPALHSIYPEYQKEINNLISKLYRYNKKAIGFLGFQPSSVIQKELIETYRNSYCERFDIPENIEVIDRKPLSDTVMRNACNRLISNGANGIITETAELATLIIKLIQAKIINIQGVMLACIGNPGISDYLPRGLLIHSETDIESMAAKVISLLI
jgi:DNA-binding LacI/PurR family transcriptional regulator